MSALWIFSENGGLANVHCLQNEYTYVRVRAVREALRTADLTSLVRGRSLGDAAGASAFEGKGQGLHHVLYVAVSTLEGTLGARAMSLTAQTAAS